MSHLFCFGFGFTARRLAAKYTAAGWTISATARSEDKCAALKGEGIDCQIFDGTAPVANMAALEQTTHLLLSAPPGEAGDPVFNLHRYDLAALPNLQWIGYLSATSVYGDTKGSLVDENAALRATTIRGRRRIESEEDWLNSVSTIGLPVHVFRLAGIYGPGRSAIDQLRAGRARRIIKPGHLFSRIHVDDIVSVLDASIRRVRPGSIYNVCDEEAAMSSTVVEYAAELLGVDPPPAMSFEDAEISDMARSFYADNRRIDNKLIKSALGVKLTYPNYRAGLQAILAATAD